MGGVGRTSEAELSDTITSKAHHSVKTPSTNQMNCGDIRVLDRAGEFVCVVDAQKAQEWTASGRAVMEGKGRRAFLRLKSARLKSDYGGGSASHQKTFYDENYAGHPITILKRLHGDGTFHKWDDNLTFEELRAGKTNHRTGAAEIVAMQPAAAMEAAA